HRDEVERRLRRRPHRARRPLAALPALAGQPITLAPARRALGGRAGAPALGAPRSGRAPARHLRALVWAVLPHRAQPLATHRIAAADVLLPHPPQGDARLPVAV